MADTRYWSKDFMTSFIEEYKLHPCLWKIRSKEYTNKNLKNESYEKLVNLCKTIYPEANRDFVVKTIQSLRGSFRKEVKKVEESKRSGASADDVYVSSLWYYDLLLFTKDQEMPTNSISNVEETETQDFEQELSELPGPPEVAANVESTQIRNTASPSLSTSKKNDNSPKRKRKLNASTECKEFFDMCKTALGSHSSSIPLTEFDAVGVNVAKKLQSMQPTQAIFAESIINQVLTKGLLGTLTCKSNVSDGADKDPSLSVCYSSSTSRPPSAFSYNPGEVTQSWQTQYSEHTAAHNSKTQCILNQKRSSSNTSAALFYDSSDVSISNNNN